MSVSRPSGQVNLGVVVEPVPSQEWAEGKGQPAVLYIRDAAGKSQASTAAAKQLFNSTPAETGALRWNLPSLPARKASRAFRRQRRHSGRKRAGARASNRGAKRGSAHAAGPDWSRPLHALHLGIVLDEIDLYSLGEGTALPQNVAGALQKLNYDAPHTAGGVDRVTAVPWMRLSSRYSSGSTRGTLP